MAIRARNRETERASGGSFFNVDEGRRLKMENWGESGGICQFGTSSPPPPLCLHFTSLHSGRQSQNQKKKKKKGGRGNRLRTIRPRALVLYKGDTLIHMSVLLCLSSLPLPRSLFLCQLRFGQPSLWAAFSFVSSFSLLMSQKGPPNVATLPVCVALLLFLIVFYCCILVRSAFKRRQSYSK